VRYSVSDILTGISGWGKRTKQAVRKKFHADEKIDRYID
jgi:hypothetical protein